MINLKKWAFFSCFLLCLFASQCVLAAKLAIVIDDFGYRKHNDEQIISLSPFITVAVLPNAPNAKQIATRAHENGNDVIIHLPMAPISKQPLEVDTLFPSMDERQIERIINNAVERVPYAIGVNNHMGSLMTADLAGMQRVMKALSNSAFFFLDSKTIGKSKVKESAAMYDVPIITRDVFLDDKQIESAISQQLDLAIAVARKRGEAIAIGHPHPQTVSALKNKLANLPADIELIKLSQLVTPSPVKPKVTLTLIIETYQKKWQQVLALYALDKE